MASADLTLPRQGGALTATAARPFATAAALLARLIDRLDTIALGVLLIAAAFPASAPTVGEVVSGSGSGFWQTRLGPANALELMLVILAALAVLRALVLRPTRSSFDRPLLGAALIILALQVVALPLHLSSANYVPLDFERLLFPAAAYLIVTRAIRNPRQLRIFTIAIAAVIGVRAIELVIDYGFTGGTEFGTITGGRALLITEDTLLVLLPLALAWGALVDGRLTIPAMIGAIALVTVLLGIDLLSLRRGAMLLIGGALLARSLGISRRRLLQCAVAIAVVAALAVAAGPGRPLLHQLRYTAVSSLLKTKDASSSQRTAEITSFTDNMDGVDWVTGHGLGTSWSAYAKAPIDALSFGTGEDEFIRVGWHVYGLDWAYKFGLAGLAALFVAFVLMGRQIWRAYRRAEPQLQTLIYSLAVCVLPFLLLLFTNPRVGLIGGVTVGLLSRCCDLAGQTRTSPSGRPGSPDSSAVTSSA